MHVLRLVEYLKADFFRDSAHVTHVVFYCIGIPVQFKALRTSVTMALARFVTDAGVLTVHLYRDMGGHLYVTVNRQMTILIPFSI
jgi:hypothetical protein